ncbi:DUF3267 domain-containing protein [Clostridium perfringens]|uniref:DUF3267 domain-containing protein n=2 Tax=Clostridiaceae TaxID=31979 RepID=UPI0009D6C454|nr:DUF3267 domain-containing protein [Clostridium perfringens]MDK7629721.1 DUF3267 domain-containing protein [Clostridium sp. UMB9555A]
MLIGLIVSMAFLVVHELLHAMCFPREYTAEIFYSPAGLSIIHCAPISKTRYAIILVVPAVILGLLPLIIWTFIPFTNTTLSLILFIVSIGDLGGTSNDLYNFYQVIKVMPKNSFMITSKANCYFFFTRELNLFNKKIQYKLILDFYLMKIKRLFVISFSKL